MDAWHLRGTPELGARDACLTAVTSFGRLTDTLTKCLTAPLTAADAQVRTLASAAGSADILLTFGPGKHQRRPPDLSGNRL
jgi:hypothetical protein